MAPHFRPISESAIVQNPSVGAYAVWRFGCSYQAREGRSVILPLAFIVLPLVLHQPTLEIVLGTQKGSGLALFAGKLGEKRENLLAIHDRIRTLRELTLESVIIGEQSRLLSINPKDGTIRANGLDDGVKIPLLPERIKWLGPSCEKLGHWFGGMTDHQIVHMLNLEF
jgi:hypothetical protein